MPTNFTGNPASADSPSPAPNLSGNYPIATLPADGDALTAASVAQEARLGPNWTAYALERMRDQLFGTGVDGALSQAAGGTTDITGVAMWSTVSVTFGVIRTNGYPIIARNSITVGGPSGGIVSGSGNGASYYLGAVGPHGSTVATVGVLSTAAPYAQSLTCYGLGGNSGRGGGSISSGGAVVSPGLSYKGFPFRFHGGQPIGQTMYIPGVGPFPGSTTYDAIKGGVAGTCGDYMTGTTASGIGGAGGALVVLIAPVINLLSNAYFNSVGGIGTAGTGTNVNGGGGGGGGAFLFVCQTLNITGTPTYNANSAVGGVATGTGQAGSVGAVGNTTPYIVLVP